MKIINSYIYKSFIIWKLENGYMVEDTNGETFLTLKAAKQRINKMV